MLTFIALKLAYTTSPIIEDEKKKKSFFSTCFRRAPRDRGGWGLCLCKYILRIAIASITNLIIKVAKK